MIGVQDIGQLIGLVESQIVRILYLGFLIECSPLGSHQYHTESSSCTINGSCRGIFQERHIVDVVRVQLVQIRCGNLYTVQQDEW